MNLCNCTLEFVRSKSFVFIIDKAIECKYNLHQCTFNFIFATKIDLKHFSVALLLKCMFDIIDINRNTDDSNSNDISVCNIVQCNFSQNIRAYLYETSGDCHNESEKINIEMKPIIINASDMRNIQLNKIKTINVYKNVNIFFSICLQ